MGSTEELCKLDNCQDGSPQVLTETCVEASLAICFRLSSTGARRYSVNFRLSTRLFPPPERNFLVGLIPLGYNECFGAFGSGFLFQSELAEP